MSRHDEPRGYRNWWKDGPRATRLGRRLLIWFLVLSLVPLAAAITVGYLRSRDIIGALAERDLAVVAEVQVVHIRDRMDRYVSYLRAIGTGNEFLTAGLRRAGGDPETGMSVVADRAALDTYLRRQLAELPYFDALSLEAADGTVVAGTAPVDLSPWSHWEVAAEALIAAVPAPVPGDPPSFRVVAPVTSSSGEVAGRLVGTIPSADASTFFNIPEHVGTRIESFILDERGHPLFASDPYVHVNYTEPLESPLVGAPGTSSARYRNGQGLEVVARALAIPGHSWTYVAEAPVAEALGELRVLRTTSLYLGFLFALAVVGAAWILAGGIVAPVRRLVEATRELAAGRLAARVESSQRDEIGELGRAFNDMAAELERTSNRIRELHAREIERAQQLATVGELASGVAHEIKNPVVGIASGLDLVRKRIGQDPALEPIITELTRDLGRIEGAIRDLLAFARPTQPTLAAVDGNRVVERALRLVQASAEQREIAIELRLEPELPELLADAELVRQALVNVMLNAIQATPPHGRIVVASSCRNGDVELRVTDNGRGIPAEQRELIFRPFYTTRHMGTGLGLSITKGIVERHGGRIEVESEEGVGTSFAIHLPARSVDSRHHSGTPLP